MIALDRESLLVHVAASVRLADLESHLVARGLTLDVAHDPTNTDASDAFDRMTVGEWLEAGAPGARSAWLDPTDHLVAGFSARIRSSGASFSLRPAPRRATGPDLGALVFGLRGRMLALESVWLRVHRAGAPRATTEDFSPVEEPLSDDERELFDAIAAALE